MSTPLHFSRDVSATAGDHGDDITEVSNYRDLVRVQTNEQLGRACYMTVAEAEALRDAIDAAIASAKEWTS